MSERDVSDHSHSHSQSRDRLRLAQRVVGDGRAATEGLGSRGSVRKRLGLPTAVDHGGVSAVADLVAGVQRTIGNAAVQRFLGGGNGHSEPGLGGDRSAVIWRAPDPTQGNASGTGFRFEQNGFVFFEARSEGMRFLVGVPSEKEKVARGALSALGQRMAKDNGVIKDAALQVMTCIITNTGSRMALWKNRPTLLINHIEADVETVAHEMGHAVFYYLEQRANSTEADAKPAGQFRVAVADIFNRLSSTKAVKKTVHTRKDGKIEKEEAEEPAGLWIVDPSQWKGGKQPLREHPWDDPDEFFGSAKEAYQINRKGLDAAIKRFAKIDPAVEAPMKELIGLMDALFGKADLPTSSLAAGDAGREAEATKALAGVKQPSSVENASDAGVQILIGAA